MSVNTKIGMRDQQIRRKLPYQELFFKLSQNNYVQKVNYSMLQAILPYLQNKYYTLQLFSKKQAKFKKKDIRLGQHFPLSPKMTQAFTKKEAQCQTPNRQRDRSIQQGDKMLNQIGPKYEQMRKSDINRQKLQCQKLTQLQSKEKRKSYDQNTIQDLKQTVNVSNICDSSFTSTKRSQRKKQHKGKYKPIQKEINQSKPKKEPQKSKFTTKQINKISTSVLQRNYTNINKQRKNISKKELSLSAVRETQKKKISLDTINKSFDNNKHKTNSRLKQSQNITQVRKCQQLEIIQNPKFQIPKLPQPTKTQTKNISRNLFKQLPNSIQTAKQTNNQPIQPYIRIANPDIYQKQALHKYIGDKVNIQIEIDLRQQQVKSNKKSDSYYKQQQISIAQKPQPQQQQQVITNKINKVNEQYQQIQVQIYNIFQDVEQKLKQPSPKKLQIIKESSAQSLNSQNQAQNYLDIVQMINKTRLKLGLITM